MAYLESFFVPLSLKTPRNNPTSPHNGPIKILFYKILIFQHTNNDAIQNSKSEPKNSHYSVTLKNSVIVEDSCFIQDFCSVKDFRPYFQDFFLRSILTKCPSRFPAKLKISCSVQELSPSFKNYCSVSRFSSALKGTVHRDGSGRN